MRHILGSHATCLLELSNARGRLRALFEDNATLSPEDIETARTLLGAMERDFDRLNVEAAYVQELLDEVIAGYGKQYSEHQNDTRIEQLERLTRLRTDGILTDEEFAAETARIAPPSGGPAGTTSD
jgi:hypothetical protein